MNIKGLFIISMIMMSGLAYSQAPKAATAPPKPPAPPMVRLDTAVVRSYDRIPVFYHCKPLHGYTPVGMMTRTAFASYSSQVLSRYAHAARHKYKSTSIGIVIDNLNFGPDSFLVVHFSPADGRADTAVFSTPIFFSAKPTKAYKVIRVLNNELGYGSLNSNLQRYLLAAGSLHVPYDGIMVRDVSYTFGRDEIFVFRWQKK